MRREALPGPTSEQALLTWVRSVAHLHSETQHEGGRAEEDYEMLAGEWVFLAVWSAIAYYGITLTTFAWYWPVGVGFIVGLACAKLLTGPFRAALSGSEHRYLLAVILGAAALFLLQTHL